MSFFEGNGGHMNFTFGITTSGGNKAKLRIEEIINSIDSQSVKIPKCQVIIIGGTSLYKKKDLKTINTDSNCSVDYIPSGKTGKKNLIIEHATHENIVYMDDDLFLDVDWYKNFASFGNGWDLCMSVIVNTNRKRHKDWITWNHPNIHPETKQVVKDNGGGSTLMHYDYSGKHMGISGLYWVAKKHVMENEPLLDNDSECMKWFLGVRDKYRYVMNPDSKVYLLNYKPLDATWFNFINKKPKW